MQSVCFTQVSAASWKSPSVPDSKIWIYHCWHFVWVCDVCIFCAAWWSVVETVSETAAHRRLAMMTHLGLAGVCSPPTLLFLIIGSLWQRSQCPQRWDIWHLQGTSCLFLFIPFKSIKHYLWSWSCIGQLLSHNGKKLCSTYCALSLCTVYTVQLHSLHT